MCMYLYRTCKDADHVILVILKAEKGTCTDLRGGRRGEPSKRRHVKKGCTKNKASISILSIYFKLCIYLHIFNKIKNTKVQRYLNISNTRKSILISRFHFILKYIITFKLST